MSVCEAGTPSAMECTHAKMHRCALLPYSNAARNLPRATADAHQDLRQLQPPPPPLPPPRCISPTALQFSYNTSMATTLSLSLYPIHLHVCVYYNKDFARKAFQREEFTFYILIEKYTSIIKQNFFFMFKFI